MDNEYLVSICVPVYGVENYIERCARSIFEQTYKNLEIIFVDDKSRDLSIFVLNDIVNEYEERKNQVRIIHHDVNRGLAAARNTAVCQAKGDFIMHVDSDDWIEKNAVELFVRKQQETKADIVSSNAIAHYNGFECNLIEQDYENKDDMIMTVIQMTLDHVIWRRLIRSSLYRDNNVSAKEGINIGEDHHTLPRLVYYAKSVAKIDEFLYHYNCMNTQSYMHINDFEKQQIRINNDLVSIDILIDFFNGKNINCVDRLLSIKIEKLNSCLYMYIHYRQKKLYQEILKEIRCIDKYYWNKIGYNNFIKRWIISNYWLNLLKYKIFT